MKIEQVDEFNKDVKKLEKKFRTIRADLENFKKILIINPEKLVGAIPVHYQEVKINPKVKVYKAKKFRCRYLKGRGCFSGIRVIYGFWWAVQKITLLEIYYKKKRKKDCDLERLKYYFGVQT
ncbi:MAG: hypothetical protein IB617_02190 [Candidatus Nealsonbacteria bacterium]|nr:MAG: hypothetical protein IB617_02190 [Candidatus Nealsonbacteria bacterium]